LRSSIRPFIAVVVATITLTSCSAPSQTYASSKSEGVYFAVPNGWHAVLNKDLNAFESKSTATGAAEKLALVKWQVAYSPDSKIGSKEVFAFSVIDAPLAFARVRSLFPGEVNAVSYNTLRDLVVPLTDWVNNPTKTTPKFSIIDDYEVVEKGARGVRTIYSFTQDGQAQTVDQTAMVSNDRQTMYVFVIRCSDVCYKKNKKTMTAISDSFTVRGR